MSFAFNLMFGLSAGQDVQIQPGVKADKTVLVAHGQTQQVLAVHVLASSRACMGFTRPRHRAGG